MDRSSPGRYTTDAKSEMTLRLEESIRSADTIQRSITDWIKKIGDLAEEHKTRRHQETLDKTKKTLFDTNASRENPRENLDESVPFNRSRIPTVVPRNTSTPGWTGARKPPPLRQEFDLTDEVFETQIEENSGAFFEDWSGSEGSSAPSRKRIHRVTYSSGCPTPKREEWVETTEIPQYDDNNRLQNELSSRLNRLDIEDEIRNETRERSQQVNVPTMYPADVTSNDLTSGLGITANNIPTSSGFNRRRENRPVARTRIIRKSTINVMPCNRSNTSDRDLRLMGELAYQLDQRILKRVFGRPLVTRRYYGYTTLTIPLFITVETTLFGPADQFEKEELRDHLQLRYDRLMKKLKLVGFDQLHHARFIIEVINRCGLSPARCCHATRGQVMRMLDRQSWNAPWYANMMVLMDCLVKLADESGQPLFMCPIHSERS